MKIQEKELSLIKEIEERLPEFAKAAKTNVNHLLLHQDAFTADYQEDEFTLLGKAIKYAGIYGKEIHIIGTNRETLK